MKRSPLKNYHILQKMIGQQLEQPMSERGLLEAKNTLYKVDRLSSTIIRSRIPIYKRAQQCTYLIMTEQVGKEVMEKTTEEPKPGAS